MEFVDNILNRIDTDKELRKSVNALVCFNDAETGKHLSKLAAFFTLSKIEKSSVTFLQIIDEDDDTTQLIDKDVYQNIFIAENKGEKEDKGESKVVIRSFVSKSDDFVQEIINRSKEQKSNLVLIGIDKGKMTYEMYKKFISLRSNPKNTDKFIYDQFLKDEAIILKNITTLFETNPVATGLFINKGFDEIKNIFVPILSLSDLQVLPFIYIRLSQTENIKVMIWDAIGAIQSYQKVQKLYQSFAKKTDEKVELWDISKKIDDDFILKQDLFIIGIDGWRKLMNTPLEWTKNLPSTLIFKDKTI